ncbi:HIT family protein [Haloferula sp. BvORR071]|uniref:HIT family protein n=1 Tax=Haloferula sp. BvORR071 TaxID=1396141 RepID=UPI0009461A37|nr:HIT family protein [Haloferula sp. BvORR071]
MTPCTFCRIISGELSSARVGENELAIAFLDIRPVHRGHTLVVPRRHVPSFGDLTDSESSAVFRLIREVSSALKSELSECAGITLSAADGEAAGQEVFHAHFHVIPRSSGDDFGWRRLGTAANPEELNATASLIRRSRAPGEAH